MSILIDQIEAGSKHLSVMLPEVLATLAPKRGETIIDGTFGAGGYSRVILETGAKVIGFDRDITAINNAFTHENLTLLHDRFSNMADHVDKVDGIVLDLGVSSMQFDEGGRGFSFRYDAPLDMRMGLTEISAADIVNSFEEKELADLIYLYGEERASRPIAREIVKSRPINTTFELVAAITKVLYIKRDEIHPATRTFQALRIAVNEELAEIEQALKAAEAILRPGGRLVVVSFHSLEDRIMKDFTSKRSGKNEGSRYAPAVTPLPATFKSITRKALTASPDELKLNPRARSAKLRAAIRVEV
jgi:16S rRNA (cytosine1402-N4)-methyltransferase